MAKKKRNPQDATRRNVQAANKRFAALLDQVNTMMRQLTMTTHRVTVLEARLVNEGFATAQRSLGYPSSTAPKQQVIVQEK